LIIHEVEFAELCACCFCYIYHMNVSDDRVTVVDMCRL